MNKEEKIFSAMSHADLNELMVLKSNVESFIDSDLYEKSIKPKIEAEQKKLNDMIIWTPSSGVKPDISSIGSMCLYNSGMINGIDSIYRVLENFIMDGEEAMKELKKRESKETEKNK